jgi:hypothetical protein
MSASVQYVNGDISSGQLHEGLHLGQFLAPLSSGLLLSVTQGKGEGGGGASFTAKGSLLAFSMQRSWSSL